MTALRLTILAAATALALAGCASTDPLGEPSADATSAQPVGGQTLVVGSQQYYSNEIIAELYAQALEAEGYTVDRQFQIGQRETYLPELEAGKIDVFPEYTGNLLQYVDAETTARTADEVNAALAEALPDGLRVLDPAEATDQDSYTVTAAFAEEHGLTAIADLAGVGEPLKMAANSEFATRPYGPGGAKEIYGVDIEVLPVEDSGGPLTVRALTDGTVQVADIYTADPAIAANDLIVLEDPEGLILPQQVVPLVSDKVDDAAEQAIASVNEKLTPEALRELNARSVDEQLGSEEIAGDWLEENDLL
ncbi:ABC transporter substrate-binding protein [Tessaracoccus sp. MC1756]|uniref:ABC transporter substrate-binding protein n=1 Tax=Tessaracoccus sp. MC1756 TaxID=2760311 RepID=UPI001602C349|nr:ABC transporter substrate-binding protein [Tessaracoccus sp. MC1756]MBB1509425.1 ABC transporter substrate-binding protein [Tessaracoccus sp. MC1756]